MTHHWRPSDGLLPTQNPSEWMLYDRGRLIGHIQGGRLNRSTAFRAVLRHGDLVQVLGYSPSLEQCCTDLWQWHVRFVVRSGAATA